MGLFEVIKSSLQKAGWPTLWLMWVMKTYDIFRVEIAKTVGLEAKRLTFATMKLLELWLFETKQVLLFGEKTKIDKRKTNKPSPLGTNSPRQSRALTVLFGLELLVFWTHVFHYPLKTLPTVSERVCFYLLLHRQQNQQTKLFKLNLWFWRQTVVRCSRDCKPSQKLCTNGNGAAENVSKAFFDLVSALPKPPGSSVLGTCCQATLFRCGNLALSLSTATVMASICKPLSDLSPWLKGAKWGWGGQVCFDQKSGSDGFVSGSCKEGGRFAEGSSAQEPAVAPKCWAVFCQGLADQQDGLMRHYAVCVTILTILTWRSKKRGQRRGDLATPNPNCIKLFMRRTKKQRKKRAGFQHVWQLLPLNPTWTWLKKSTLKRSLFDTDSAQRKLSFPMWHADQETLSTNP